MDPFAFDGVKSIYGLPAPDDLYGLRRGTVTNNELQASGMGVTVAYSDPGIETTLYLYDFGEECIPSDPKAELVGEHLRQCVDDALRAAPRLRNELRLVAAYGTGSPHPDIGVEYL